MSVVVPEDIVTSPSAQSPKYNGASMPSVIDLRTLGIMTSGSHHSVSVPAIACARSDSLTLPVTVSLAFGVLPVALSIHAPPT